MKKSSFEFLFLIFLAAASAINYKIFVLPNKFAPAGIDGICVMLQYITKTNIGYLSLLFNLPLLLLAFFVLNKNFTLKTLVYSLSFSLSSIVLDYLDISRFVYYTENGTSIVLAPFAAGVIRGVLYAFTLKLNASSGGIDIVAAFVGKKKPEYNFMSIVFFLNFCIALSSYFVYDFKIEPVICSIIYSFITAKSSFYVENKIKKEKAACV